MQSRMRSCHRMASVPTAPAAQPATSTPTDCLVPLPAGLCCTHAQVALLSRHAGLQVVLKDGRRSGIKGGVLRQYVQYDS